MADCQPRGEGKLWLSHCIDLDLYASGKSLEDAKTSLFDAIQGYLETVFDTEERDSIPELLNRKAPLFYRLRWEVSWRLSKWRHRHDGPGPFQLAPEFKLSQVTA